MKLEGTPKEIADFVLAVQGRQEEESGAGTYVSCIGEEIFIPEDSKGKHYNLNGSTNTTDTSQGDMLTAFSVAAEQCRSEWQGKKDSELIEKMASWVEEAADARLFN